MRRFFKNNGLSIALFGLFLFSIIGQYLTGFKEYNDDLQEHNQQNVVYVEYLSEGHFIEAVFENWESEFLQMGMYVVLTIFLFKKDHLNQRNPAQSTALILFPKNLCWVKMRRCLLSAAVLC